MFLHFKAMSAMLRHIVAVPELPPAAWLGASAAASMAMQIVPVGSRIVWIPAGVMLVALLLFMTGDLLTEYFGMAASERSVYLWEREITGKFLLLTLVVMSIVLDVVIYICARYLPGEFLVLDRGFLFITITTELWLIAAEISRITRNIAHAEGTENIPPPLRMFAKHVRRMLSTLRVVDQQRAKEMDQPRKLNERWYDGELSEEEIQLLAERLSDHRNNKGDK